MIDIDSTSMKAQDAILTNGKVLSPAPLSFISRFNAIGSDNMKAMPS